MSMGSQYDQDFCSEGSPSPSNEDGHYFNFEPFYRQPQFCDRFIRLEVLGEEQPGRVVGRESDCITGKKRPREDEGNDNVTPSETGSAKAPDAGSASKKPKKLAVRPKVQRKSAPATGYKYRPCKYRGRQCHRCERAKSSTAEREAKETREAQEEKEATDAREARNAPRDGKEGANSLSGDVSEESSEDEEGEEKVVLQRKSAPATGYKPRGGFRWAIPIQKARSGTHRSPSDQSLDDLSDDEEPEERVLPQGANDLATGGSDNQCSKERRNASSEEGRRESGSSEAEDEVPVKAPLTRVEEIPISSIVVAAKSQVLRAMLESEMLEGQRGAPIVLKVTPQEKEVFKEMIDFTYTGVLSERLLAGDSTPELVAALLVADKFDAQSFLDAILGVLMERATTWDTGDLERIAFDIPDVLRLRSGVDRLVDSAQAFLLESFKIVDDWKSSSLFLDLGEKAVLFLLECDLEGSGEEAVIDGVLAWVGHNLPTASERVAALERLAPKIRFGCCSGEFLERLMEREGTQSPIIQGLLQKALTFQAYSEPKKLKSLSSFSRERAGFKKDTVDVLLNVTINGSSTRIKTAKWSWLGRTWMFIVEKEEGLRPDQSRVGFYLQRCAVATDKGEVNRADTIEFRVYVRVSPSGYWVLLKETSPYRFSKETAQGRGSPKILKCSWDAVQGSQYASCTGEVNFRVVAKRLPVPIEY